MSEELSRPALLADLAEGLSAEKRAAELYQRLAEESEGEIKDIAAKIATEEERHAVLVQEMIDLVEKYY